MNLPIFAINLDRETGRWSELLASAEAAGLTLQRIAAIDGRALAKKDWTEIDLPTARKLSGRDILPGEYACYRSHIQALETFLADGSAYGLIVEDDILFGENTRRRIEAIIAAVPDFDVIKLVNNRMGLFLRAVETTEGDEIGRTLHGWPGSAAAYLVTRRGGAGAVVDARGDENAVGRRTRTVLGYRPESLFGPPKPALLRRQQRCLRHNRPLGQLQIRAASLADLAGRRGVPGQGTVDPTASRLPTAAPAAGNPRLRQDDAPRNNLLLVLAGSRHSRPGLSGLARGRHLPLCGGGARRGHNHPLAQAGLLDLQQTADRRGRLSLRGLVVLRFIRLAIVYFGTGQLGSAEGIYLFPLLYASTGFSLLLFVRRPAQFVLWFMILSLVFLAADTGYSDILHGIRPQPRLFNNPIHASVAAGFIFLCALQFMANTVQRKDLNNATRTWHWALSAAVLLFALVNIIALRSKGVWLALALVLPLLAVMMLARGHRRELMVGAGVLAIVAAGVVATHNIFWSTAGDTMIFLKALVPDALSHGVVPAFERAIAGDTIPVAARERLMLWADALKIWKRHPIFGASSAWLTEWQHRTYHPDIYNLLHNGYLEIAVRYGAIGLAFYAFLYIWSSRQVLLAMRAKLIAPAAWSCYISTLVFFAITILTNSNTRLAIGESFMWFAAAFGFYCFYLRQQKNLVEPRTYL